jgi:probable HAF family extracellular repeat protein
MASPLLAQTSYTFTDLGINGSGSAVNLTGQVAGALNGEAALSGPDGGTLNPLLTSQSFATGVNDAGQVAGSSGDPSSPQQAFFVASSGSVTFFGNLPGGSSTGAWGINNLGQVVGDAGVTGGATHAFVSGPNGGALTDLGTFGGTDSSGRAVNDLGQVAGYSQTSDPMGLNTVYRAFLSGVSNDLGALGGSGASSWGYGVNNLGQVTGMSDLLPGNPFSFPRHAFLTAPGGGPMMDLGALGSGMYAQGEAVNNSGTVVGQSLSSSGALVGFVYTASGGMQDLNDLIPSGTGLVIDVADGINDLGQITGEAIDSMGRDYAFLLTPIEAVPEPATWLVGGLALLVLVRKRRSL